MRRFLLPASAVLTLLGACHRTPDEIAPDAAPPPVASVSAPAAAAVASSAPPSPVHAFCEDAFTADQARMKEKCTVADYGTAQTVAEMAASFCSRDLGVAISRGRASFDHDAADRCVEMLREKPLSSSFLGDTFFGHSPCDRALVGLQPEGQPCRFSIECKDGLACVGYGPRSDGTCKKPPAAQEACNLQQFASIFSETAVAARHPDCAPGAYCDGKTCQARVAKGKACTKSDVCVAGLSCVVGKCGKPGAAGASCAAASDCAFPLFCDAAGGHVCASKHDDGQACTQDDACKGHCEFPKAQGGVAAPAGVCQSVCGSG